MPSRWEKLKINDGMTARRHVDPGPTVGPEGWWCWLLLTSPPTHQENVHDMIMRSLNHYFKTSHYLLQVGRHNFEGMSPLRSLLPGKVIKRPFSTSPKAVSEIQFHTGVQRSWVFGIIWWWWWGYKHVVYGIPLPFLLIHVFLTCTTYSLHPNSSQILTHPNINFQV